MYRGVYKKATLLLSFFFIPVEYDINLIYAKKIYHFLKCLNLSYSLCRIKAWRQTKQWFCVATFETDNYFLIETVGNRNVSKTDDEVIGISHDTKKSNILKKLITSGEGQEIQNKIVRWKDLEQGTSEVQS